MVLRAVDPVRAKRIAILSVVVLGVYYVESHLVTISSDSVRATVAWLTEGTPQKGDYATYTLDIRPYHYLDTEVFKKDSIVVTKKVACVAGETLTTQNHHVFCNGEHIAVAKTTSQNGKPLAAFEWNGVIPDGKSFLLGESNDSFDSRYWGFANQAATARAVKVL